MPDIFTSKKATKQKEENPSFVVQSKSSYKDLQTQKNHPLSSFAMCPSRVGFETMEEEEKVILFLRQHFVTNVPWILTGIIMILVPSFVSLTPFLDSVPSNFVFIFTLIWYMITYAYIFLKFISWFFNVYIITDERVIDVDFYSLIYKEVHDAQIDRIEDTTYNMGGVVRTLFNYGDVLIQTAAEIPNFDFRAVPHPDQVVKILEELQNKEEDEREGGGK